MGCILSSEKLDLTALDLNCVPPEEVVEICNKIDETIKMSKEFFDISADWNLGENIQKHIKNDSDYSLFFDCLTDVTEKLKKLNDMKIFSEKITSIFVEIVTYLLSFLPINKIIYNPIVELKLNENWLLIKKTAELMSTVLEIDRKNSNINIQNDLSVLKRICTQKINMNFNKTNENVEILQSIKNFAFPDFINEKNLINLNYFYRFNTPFINNINIGVGNLIKNEDNPVIDQIIENIPNIFVASIDSGILSESEKRSFANAIVTLILISDHVLPEGVFHNYSKVNIKRVTEIFTKDFDKTFEKSEEIDSKKFLSEIKFWSLHFNDRTNPNRIKRLF